jgi:hypothetical protein
MKLFHTHHHYALVTAILPRQTQSRVVTEVLASGAAQVMGVSARGSLLQ